MSRIRESFSFTCALRLAFPGFANDGPSGFVPAVWFSPQTALFKRTRLNYCSCSRSIMASTTCEYLIFPRTPCHYPHSDASSLPLDFAHLPDFLLRLLWTGTLWKGVIADECCHPSQSIPNQSQIGPNLSSFPSVHRSPTYHQTARSTGEAWTPDYSLKVKTRFPHAYY